MRLVLPLVLLAGVSARADVSLDARAAGPRPHTPLGPACDAAIAAAQARFSERSGDIRFHVRERRVVGKYEWSDMCGVWGRYSLELAPDNGPPTWWRWSEWREKDETAIHKRGILRGYSMHARFILDGDTGSSPGDWFVESFKPAAEACLATLVP
jgi:hypothetical protein